MKRTAFLILVACTAVCSMATDYTKYVNPFIGTQTDDTGALSGSTFPAPRCRRAWCSWRQRRSSMSHGIPAAAMTTTATPSSASRTPT